MNGWPLWNYWMYDESGEYDYKLENLGYEGADEHFLKDTDYEPEWAQRFFWSIDEAAALSFGRSPTKVPNDTYMKDMYGYSQFANYFCELRDTIAEAQATGALPSPIPALMYVEWAGWNDLPFPPQLAQEVRLFFDSVMKQGVARSERRETDPAPEENSGSDLRRHHTLLGIIYSLAWKHYRWGPRSNNNVAENLERVLIELRLKKPDAKFAGSTRTITDLLIEARDHFSDPPSTGGN
jgi:hypothetical protein